MERPFDVFLSHNSRDKPVVREVCEKLRERGLRPWLDAEELIPGGDWQKALESILETVPAAAMFFGSSGLWPSPGQSAEDLKPGGHRQNGSRRRGE